MEEEELKEWPHRATRLPKESNSSRSKKWAKASARNPGCTQESPGEVLKILSRAKHIQLSGGGFQLSLVFKPLQGCPACSQSENCWSEGTFLGILAPLIINHVTWTKVLLSHPSPVNLKQSLRATGLQLNPLPLIKWEFFQYLTLIGVLSELNEEYI